MEKRERTLWGICNWLLFFILIKSVKPPLNINTMSFWVFMGCIVYFFSMVGWFITGMIDE